MSRVQTPNQDLRLPEHLRNALAEPFGPIVQTDDLLHAIDDRPVIAVGDVVSVTLRDLGVQPWLFVCDFKTQRGDDDERFRRSLGSWGDRAVRVRNPAGMITVDAWQTVASALEQPHRTITRIVVDGEEDLLGLPIFVLAPIGTVVLYGMPNQGVVVAVIDVALRQRARDLLTQMTDRAEPPF